MENCTYYVYTYIHTYIHTYIVFDLAIINGDFPQLCEFSGGYMNCYQLNSKCQKCQIPERNYLTIRSGFHLCLALRVWGIGHFGTMDPIISHQYTPVTYAFFYQHHGCYGFGFCGFCTCKSSCKSSIIKDSDDSEHHQGKC